MVLHEQLCVAYFGMHEASPQQVFTGTVICRRLAYRVGAWQRCKAAWLWAQVTGQNADMADLQRLMMRGKTKMNSSQQQNLTVSPLALSALPRHHGLDKCTGALHSVVLKASWCTHYVPKGYPGAQRLAVYEAARLLRDNDAPYKALQEAMQNGSSVPDCIRAIENA